MLLPKHLGFYLFFAFRPPVLTAVQLEITILRLHNSVYQTMWLYQWINMLVVILYHGAEHTMIMTHAIYNIAT